MQDEEAPSQWRKAIYEIDLLDLVRDVRGGWRVILSLLVLAFFYSVFTVSVGQRTYTATMLMSSADQSGSQGISGALSQVAGAANLLGIGGIGGADNSLFSKYSALLDSYDLSAAILKHDELKPMLFGPGWNPATRTWTRPDEFVFNVKDFLKGLIGLPRWTPPTPYTMRGVLKSSIVIVPDKQKGFLTLSANTNSPERSLKLLNIVYREADQLLRQTAKERSQNRIAYLRSALEQTTMQDQRTAMINVLSAEEQRLMMASADENVAIQIIDPPYAEPVPSSPKPRSVLMVNIFMAVVVGMLLSIIFGLRQRDIRRKAIAAGHDPEAAKTLDAGVAAIVRGWLGRR